MGLHREDSEAETRNHHTLAPWLKKIRQCGTINSALNTTLQALTQGLGAEHCIIMEVADRDIHTQTCYGFQKSSPINRLHIDRKKPHNLFNQLIRQPACLNLSPPAIKKMSGKIPAEFTQHYELQPCGLLSVFHHHKPKALIYCDHQHWDSEKYNNFKKVGQYLSLTLQQIHYL